MTDTQAGSAEDTAEPDDSTTPSQSSVAADPIGRPKSAGGTITVTLANAGNTLGGDDAELVLNPLRLAFETKNAKVVELALDCLHVGASCYFLSLTLKTCVLLESICLYCIYYPILVIFSFCTVWQCF